MVVDTSAILAILFDEADTGRYAEATCTRTRESSRRTVFWRLPSSSTTKRDRGRGRQRDAFIQRAQFTIAPVPEDQIRIGRQAYLDFGKANHPAGLNFGDCFAYALTNVIRNYS